MEFNCEKCHYFTKVKCNFAKHMASKRHSLDMQLPYICKCFICGRKYKSKSGLWRHQIKHKPITELLQTRIEPVGNSELLQTRIEKETVENSELLQTRIEKVPDKLVEKAIVKTYCHDNDPSSKEKRKKRIERKKENKKTQKKIRMQSHGRTKKNYNYGKKKSVL